MKKRLIVALCVAVAAALTATPSRAAQTELLVDDDGVQCPAATFTSIQAAVMDALPGATIRVCPGTYNEVVTVSEENLQLVGPSAPSGCTQPAAPNPATQAIVQASNAGGVVNLLANGIRFQQFTVQNNPAGPGVLTGASFSGHKVTQNTVQNNVFGVAFNSDGAALSAVQQNCIRQNNDVGAASGNGIYSDQGLANADIVQNIFFDNENSAIVLNGTAPGDINDVDIERNISQLDGSLLAIFNSTNTDVRSNVARNNAGSAIFIGNANSGLGIRSNSITSAARGVRSSVALGVGGPSTDVSIASNAISNSTSPTSGDGINVRPDSLTNSLISSNAIKNSARDGIRIDAGGNGGNRILSNALKSNAEHDCHDDTTGTGTAGTANTWSSNAGVTENRPGLC